MTVHLPVFQAGDILIQPRRKCKASYVLIIHNIGVRHLVANMVTIITNMGNKGASERTLCPPDLPPAYPRDSYRYRPQPLVIMEVVR